MAVPTEKTTEGPLQGIRVVDFTHVISGPFASQTLGDLGACVIKIEGVEHGDVGREMGPEKNGQSHYFVAFNRNKRSIALNLKSDAGRKVALELLAQADVVIENFAPGAIGRLGLGYDVVKATNPSIVYCSISGFGQTGPLAQKRSFDLIAQAYSGIMSTNGEPDEAPVKVGVPIGDTASSLFAVIGILAALFERKNTGAGRFIDVAMYDSMAAMCFNAVANFNATGTSQSRGAASWEETLTGRFKCSDGYVAVSLWGTVPERWVKLWALIGREDMIQHPKFDSGHPGRPENAQIARPVIDKWLAITTRKDAVELLLDLGFSAGPVQTIAEVSNCEQLKAREAFFEIEDGLGGHIRTLGVPLKFSGMSLGRPSRAPRLGEHTDEILREISKLSTTGSSPNQ